MSIQVTETTMVRPFEETPTRKLWLSGLDLVIRPHFTHTPTMTVYKHRNTTNNNPDFENLDQQASNKFFDADTMKDALSKALVTFYPLAGRLSKDNSGRLEVDCNGEGALFIEAETKYYGLADFEDENGYFTPTDKLYGLVIPMCDYSGGFTSFPLLMVQLTRFKCGGVALGFAQHHQLGDAAAYLHFLTSWTRLAKGLELEYLPILERSTYLAPRWPRQVKFHHLEYDPPVTMKGDSNLETTTTAASMCILSKDQLNALKQKATSYDEVEGFKPSTFEVLAGHVWRTACKSRELADDQDVKLLIPVDGRSRLKLPQGYFGNVIFHAACKCKAGDIVNKPLGYVTNMVHKAVRMMNNEEYLRSAIDHLELQPDITALARGDNTYACPNLVINSWIRLPNDELDFGWGKPIFGGSGGIRSEGQCFILQSPNRDGSLLVATKLCSHNITLFRDHLYDF